MAETQRHAFTINGTTEMVFAFTPKETEACPTCHHVPPERNGSLWIRYGDEPEHNIEGPVAVALNDLIMDLGARVGMRYYP